MTTLLLELLAGITATDVVLDRTMEAIEASKLAGAQVRLDVPKSKQEILPAKRT